MKLQLFALLMLAIQVASQGLYPTFAQYVQRFGKNYDAEEYAKRETIYNKKIRELGQITDYQPGVNEMTDWTDQQMKQRKNLILQPASTRLARPLPVRSRIGYPASLDWRSLNAVTSIKNQGCGDCWAFATAAYAESKLIIDKRFNATNIDLSEQYLDSCTPSSDCSGGYFEYAMKVGLNLPSETAYPYDYTNLSSSICGARRLQVGLQNSDFYNLGDSDLINLLQTGPMVVSISADDWEKYSSGVFKCKATAQINHGVLLVGYTQQYWIIKNQWGVLWGQSGFMYLTRESSFNCGIGRSAHIMTGKGDSTFDKNYVVGVDTNSQSFNVVNNNSRSADNSISSQALWSPYLLPMSLLLLLLLLV